VSAFNFLDIFAGVLGVETPMTDARFADVANLPQNDEIKVFDGKKIVRFDELKVQEALR
jgi:hypothetical protein